MQYTLLLEIARVALLLSRTHFRPSSYANSNNYVLSHHQSDTSSYTGINPALVPPICAVMRAGSLKTLDIGHLSEPDQVVQVLERLPHCTHLSQLELWLSRSDKVRHVTYNYMQCIYSMNSYYTVIDMHVVV